jgi:hypothetical protein
VSTRGLLAGLILAAVTWAVIGGLAYAAWRWGPL